MPPTIPIQADNELLELMLGDYEIADPKWKATAYWQEFAKPLTEYLQIPENVKHFRRAPLRTGIRSLNPANPGWIPTLSGRGALLLSICRSIPAIGGLIRFFEENQRILIGWHEKTFQYAQVVSFLLIEALGQGAPVLDDRRTGDPDDGVLIDGRYYSNQSLGYQQLYFSANRHLNMTSIRSVVELGSGYGGQAEVFLRNNSDVKVVAVDIPPWLYVAECYLEALFPGEVMGYRESRKLNANDNLLETMGRRRIAILSASKMKDLHGDFDLFWNSRSLQEMNENIMDYINLAADICRNLFLHAYTPSRAGIHTPELLRQMVMKTNLFREVHYGNNLFARSEGVDMFFEKSI